MIPNYVILENLLDVFVEAENLRKTGTMPGLQEKTKQIMHQQSVKNKDVESIKGMFKSNIRTKESEAIRLLNLSTAEAYIYNQTLKDMMMGMIIEMIRQGVIVLDITDSEYDINTSQMTLTMRCVNPVPIAKRINIQRKKGR